MSPVLWWVRRDLRRRWRTLAVLALLVALGAGVVMTAVAGARRGASAVDRLLIATRAATAVVLPNQPGFDWDRVRALPGVEGLSTFVVGGYHSVDGVAAEEVGHFPPGDDEAMRTVERPVVLEGRLPDVSRADEVVVTPRYPESYGKGVGETVALRLLSPEQVDAFFAGGADVPTGDGPVVEATIVGVVRSGWYGEETLDDRGSVIPSPGLARAYPEHVLGTDGMSGVRNALVRLAGGEQAIPAFREGLARVSGRSDIDVWNWADQSRRYREVTGFEANGLLAFALAGAVATLFLVGQAVARHAAAGASDVGVLRAIGLTPAQQRGALAVGPALAGLGGAGLGAIGAVVASRWLPMGTASLVEPTPGITPDWLVLASAIMVTPAAMAAVSVATLARATSRRPRVVHGSALAGAATRTGLPVPMVVGTHFAFEPGGGPQAVPVRPALLGAVVGVLGVLAALTFSSAVNEASTNPRRFGTTHHLEAFVGYNGSDFGDSRAALQVAAQDVDVVGVTDVRYGVAQIRDVDVDLFTLDGIGEPTEVVVTSGRLPQAEGEIALGPRSVEATGSGLGDTVVVEGAAGSLEASVVGTAFVPAGPHNDYATGAWTTPDTYHRVVDSFRFHVGLVALRPGADAQVVSARLGQAVGEPWFALAEPAPPPELAQLRQIRGLPLFLAGFLALLGLAALGHALASIVARRGQDLAVLRALGLTRGGSGGVIVSQASAVALVGVVAGVPLGVALGRILWRAVAERTPLEHAAPSVVAAALVVVAVALVAANVVAVWPSQRAAALRPGQVLRSG